VTRPKSAPRRRIDGRTARWEHRRPELLAAATEYVLENGVAHLTLRPLGDAIGASITTLIRQFSSKDGLIEAVCQEIHDRMIRDLRDNPALQSASPVVILRAMWKKWLVPEQARQFRFLFELYGLAIRDPDRYRWFTESVVRDYTAPLEAALIDLGRLPAEGRRLSTLVLAILRGLHLDLAATEDAARVDAAFALAIDLLEPELSGRSRRAPHARPSRRRVTPR